MLRATAPRPSTDLRLMPVLELMPVVEVVAPATHCTQGQETLRRRLASLPAGHSKVLEGLPCLDPSAEQKQGR